jgi:hypothetical protein
MSDIIRVPIKEKRILLKHREPELFKNKIVSTLSRNSSPAEESVITRYYRGIVKAQEFLENQIQNATTPIFEPPGQLPELSEDLINFFKPARARLTEIGEYKGRRLKLLNLMLDPATNTTKSLSSLVMVARAAKYIRNTGENVLILTPTSGNKGIALRSAVERAIALGMVNKEQLRVAIIISEDSAYKVRESTLFKDRELAKLNPVIVYNGESSAKLKKIGQDFQENYLDEFFKKYNARIWYTLNLANYQVPDSARAYFEYESSLQQNCDFVPAVRLHVHAVSSAFGFLGYHLGRSVLVNEGLTTWDESPGYFLVQHLKTPDMVLHYYFNSFERRNLPCYQFDETTGLYVQNENAHFPAKTFSVTENLDSTFYTSTPITSPGVSEMIRQLGGGGIVVSLFECFEEYSLVRSLLRKASVDIVADPRKVSEWALIMAMTGVLKAIDRNIIPEEAELTIQASGYYAAGVDYTAICTNNLPKINDDKPLDELKQILTRIS